VLAVCAFAVVVLKNPAIAYASTVQMIEGYPKEPVKIAEKRLTPERDDSVQLHNVVAANLHGAPAFFLAQVFMTFFVRRRLRTRDQRNHTAARQPDNRYDARRNLWKEHDAREHPEARRRPAGEDASATGSVRAGVLLHPPPLPVIATRYGL
jgi:hypothetical protein